MIDEAAYIICALEVSARRAVRKWSRRLMHRMLRRPVTRARLPVVVIPDRALREIANTEDRTQQELARVRTQRLIDGMRAYQHSSPQYEIPSGSERYKFGQVVPWNDLVAHPATCECARCKP